MRLRTWMVAVAFVASAFAPLASASADDGPQFLQTTTGAPLGTPPFQPSGAGNGLATQGLHALHAVSTPMPGQPGWAPPGAPGAGPGPGALPPGTMPWPQISPYEHAMEQHRIQDGLWYRDVSNGGRQYYSRLGATLLQVRKPNRFRTSVGDPFLFPGDTTTITTVVFQDDPPDGVMGNEFQDKLKSTSGLRAIFGWQEPWGSGVEFNAWFTPENQALYNRNNGTTPGTTHGLPLDNGAGGVLVPYDQFFGVRFSSVYAGTGVNFFTNDIWPREEVRFRVMPGFRYLYIGEEFGVTGMDSGGGVAAAYTSVIDSKNTSNLFGPQIGIDYGFGGETLKFNGRSKVGVLVNVTKYELSGRAVGDGRAPGFNPLRTFSGGETHTHFSPIFEQEVGFDMDVIGIIPVLKSCSWLDNAKIHVGYSVVLLWEVARPQYNIDYQGQPLDPRLASNLAAQRTQWYTHGWDFALTWTW